MIKGFENYGALLKHELADHKKSFSCKTCKQSFQSRVLLDRHSLTHKPQTSKGETKTFDMFEVSGSATFRSSVTNSILI